jgi:predicted phage terminase large subunit-like protein
MTILAEPSVSLWEAAARLFEPPKPKVRRWASPLDLACDLDPTMIRTPALEYINARLVELADTGETRLLVAVSPQEGKSTLCSKWYPLWRLVGDPDRRIAVVSYSDEMARRWGADIKQLVETFDGTEDTVDLGIRLRTDSRAAGRWQVDGHVGGVYCVGISGSLTGKPVDDLVIDDPIKDLAAAQSEAYRKRCRDFWQGVAVPRLGPGAKCLLVQTRWHEDDMAGWLLASDGEGDREKGGRWRVVSIPAQAEPGDVLGRQVGEYMVSARGDRDWEAIRRSVGPYVWAALYQQRPAPAEGGLFKRLWWRYWHPAPELFGQRIDCGGRIWPVRECWRFATADLAASTKTSADWTVFVAWAITLDGDLVVLDMARGQVGEGQHFALARPLIERWQLDTVFVERSQYGTTLARDAARAGVPMSPLDADADKLTRALPASSRAASGRIWLPSGADWLQVWLDETASFPSARHDDICDALAYGARVSVTKYVPPPPKTLPKPTTAEVDLMSVEM